MNDLLQLKGHFESKKNNAKGGGRKLPSGGCVTLKKMERLLEQLKKIRAYWAVNTLIEGALISVHYDRIIAKSNRISAFFAIGSKKSNDSIRGARFDETFTKHIFTHYLTLGELDKTIIDYTSCIRFVKDNIQSDISQPILNNYGLHKNKFADYGLCYTTFVGFIVDSFYVESFKIDDCSGDIEEAAIVSIYQTNVQSSKLLSDLGIDMPDIKKIDETTFRLTKEEIAILKSKAPYLISMSTLDLAELTFEEFSAESKTVIHIPEPSNEPVIGVIDTLFYENVYFGKPSGLMDQTACAVGGFSFIDFADPKAAKIEKLGFDLSRAGYSLCITNTGGNHADLNEDYASVPAEMKAVARFFGKDVLCGLTKTDIVSNAKALREAVGDRAILRALHFISENERVCRISKYIAEGDIKGFLSVIRESGRSSASLLQNYYSTKAPSEQGIGLACAIAESIMEGDGACRVHGGGFAGTAQVFVPKNKENEFIRATECAFGEGSATKLMVRPVGAVKVI